MNDNILVSIIVPIYNVEKYLSKCILSIINQTYHNIEIILINDGSLDGSLNICKKYLKEDNRIILIDGSNEGVAYARNKGLDVAQGKYICFIDADDYLEPNFVEIMLNSAIKNNADVVECNYIYITEEGRELARKQLLACNLNNPIDISKKFLLNQGFTNFIWNKIFIKDVIGNIRYKNFKTSEDYEFLANVYINCKKKINISNFLYYYVSRKSSLCHTISFDNKLDVIHAREETFRKYKNLDYKFLYQYVSFRIIFFIFQYYQESKRLNKLEKNNYRRKLLNIYKKYYKYALQLDTYASGIKIKMGRRILRNIRYRLFVILPNVTSALSNIFLNHRDKEGIK